MERFERYYRSIFHVALAINSSLDFKEVLAIVARQATEAVQVKGCFIRLLDRQGESLLPGASFGLSDRYRSKGPVRVDKSGVDREALSGRITYIADVTRDDRFQYRDEARAEGLVSLLVLPLEAHGVRIGVLRLYEDRERVFDAEESEFARSVAALSAVSLENARLHQSLKRDCAYQTSFEYRIFED